MAKKVHKSKALARRSPRAVSSTSRGLLADLRQLIAEARQTVARGVNAALVVLYWEVGQRIRSELLAQKRADYGEQIVATLSRQLTSEFGGSYTDKNLWRMIQFAETYPDREIVVSLIRQLSWTHFLALLPIKDPLARDFYAEMCRVERWTVRTLRGKIRGMLFERTALSKKPAALAKQELAKLRDEDRLTPDLVFRDPYVLDFLRLKDTYSEADLETAILRELESFLLELGVGFAFVARQVRIIIDGEDHHLDLLFYHRRLRRLVAVDLKLGKFEAAYKGQMELYLRWLEKHETQPGEDSPLGLILCAGKSDEQIELLQLDASGIHVAAYLTDLPPRDVLKRKLHEAVKLARARLAAADGDSLSSSG